ncbi:MAG TPA: hypothetical protein PLR99_09270, partial [Polyangiaceae bacterium]|nr:hypothetical protein [Polyangiaceae bacterium]
ESAGGAPPEGAGLASSPPAPTPQSAPAGDTPSAAPRAPGVRSTRPDDERSAALDRLRARLRGAGAAERLAELGIDVPAAKR